MEGGEICVCVLVFIPEIYLKEIITQNQLYDSVHCAVTSNNKKCILKSNCKNSEMNIT